MPEEKKKPSMPLYVAIILILAAAGGGFYGGTLYQASTLSGGGSARGNFQNMTPQQRQAMFAARGGGGAGATGGRTGGFRGGAVEGQVLSVSGQTMTVKAADGSTMLVLLNDSTSYLSVQDAKSTDITTGSNVMVTGTPNSDGSTTANRVELVPQGVQLFGRGPAGNGGSAPTGGQQQPAPQQGTTQQ